MRLPVVLLLAWVGVGIAHAQVPPKAPLRSPVELQLTMPQILLLPGEPVEVEVALRNSTGRPLVFTPNDDWLDMDVFSIARIGTDGTKVEQYGPVIVKEAFILESTRVARTKVDIAGTFALLRPGRYKLTASASYKGGPSRAIAEPVIFQITLGAKLWDQEFGVKTGEDEPTTTRKYLLQRLTNLKDMRLYATVTDATEQQIIRQVRLGRAAGNDTPQAKLDRLNYLHILHQTDARLFTHTVLDCDGDILRRESFESLGPRPGLKLEEDGRVSVFGGVLRPRPDDYPVLPAPGSPEPLATP